MVNRLKVLYVGVGRHGSTIPADYLQTFVQFHLELPYYQARYAPIDVEVWLEGCEPYEMDFRNIGFNSFGGGTLRVKSAGYEIDSIAPDVVVHWRKWNAEGYHQSALNVILSQDHSYGPNWLYDASMAYSQKMLDGILVFPTWHAARIDQEIKKWMGEKIPLIPGLTLGVDVDVYRPAMDKDAYHLLWASDPGRGLVELMDVFFRLWAKDRRYHLTVTYPDYVKPESLVPYAGFFKHPGVRHRPNLRNGPELWNLFNSAGILPYTSTFMEPSSRCHRQAMAAGSLVLYPPDRGTPSELLESGLTGEVCGPHLWADLIHDRVTSGQWREIGQNARSLAVSESWAVQAQRFYKYFIGRLQRDGHSD